ncbi:DUF3310 domain-containing protein [Staphylococcus arlettae]|uniref:DUF3310 domain-containing protein n=1 Tax=Staphylococcus arlettae TaxID=29378 RepID=UPI0034DCEFDB
MKIRDLDKGRYIIVYDMGKSEYSEGMAVVGQVVELIFNDEGDNAAIIQSMPFQHYTVTDDNYFDYWNDYMENKTEYIGVKHQSNDVQQRKRNDMVNSPSHYMLGNHEVKDIVSLVADKYHKGSVAHNIASALEYQMRAPEKNGLEDIKKAKKCLDFAIENWDVK